jgi:hypothetical protein
MSYYAYDANGYLGDVASVAGWAAFAPWAQAQGKQLAVLANGGHVIGEAALDALGQQLADLKGEGSSNESIRINLLALSRTATDVLIISDGEENESAT